MTDPTPTIHATIEAFAKATGLSVEMIRAHGITKYMQPTSDVPLHVLRLPWAERRALGVEFDKLSEMADNLRTRFGNDDRMIADRLQELETLLAANPLDGSASEEIDEYNVEHFGYAFDRSSSQEGA